MADPRLAKSWKATEIMLNQAAELLACPDEPSDSEDALVQFRTLIAANELELAMLELEAIARQYGARSGFWRRIQKAARQMDLPDKVAEYESDFHSALAESSE